MRAAAGANDVRTDASRKAQHHIGARAARRGRGSPRESQQGQRASEPWPGADATNLPAAGLTANLVGENRNLMPRRAQTLRRDDQVALGAAAGAIETSRKQRYTHCTGRSGLIRKRCATRRRMIICCAGCEVGE